MTALSADRNTPFRANEDFEFPVAGGVKIFVGALVALNATGYATPGAASTTLTAIGRAEEQVDNSLGADGDATVKVRRGLFRFANSGTDPIAAVDIGNDCYIEDDQTVAKTDGVGTLSIAGKIRDVDALGVWVEL